jgi:hypothetical protein
LQCISSSENLDGIGINRVTMNAITHTIRI